MEVRIRITTPPPSNFAPDNIREAWVGLEMEAVTDDSDGSDNWVGSGNVGGYCVRGSHAMQALLGAGKHEAHNFWSDLPPIEQLRFGAEFCEVVEG